MSKFTSIKSFDDYKATWVVFLEKLGPVGNIIYAFIYKCFHAYYEIKDNNLEQIVPGLKSAKTAKGEGISEEIREFCRLSSLDNYLKLRQKVKS